MKLNIHIISHPIVKYLHSFHKKQTINSNMQNQWLKQLGLFLTYETIRNWLKTYSIAIKQIHNIKKITIIDPKESYIIIANTSINLSVIQEAPYLLPKSEVKLVTSNSEDFSKQLKFPEKTSLNHIKIIIMTSEIDVNYTLAIINYLIDTKQISIQNIRLTCITCEAYKLIKISQMYPLLNIFTANLINNT